MNPADSQFDEVGARRIAREHDSGAHEVFGPQAMMGKVPPWLQEKRHSCPHCREEDEGRDDNGPTGSLIPV
jgi:hypothetical protein